MPRLSIARLMGLVGIVATDCWVVRNFVGSPNEISSFGFVSGELDLALVPMATILAIGFAVVRRDQARRPSFIGFQATGWAMLLVYVGFCVMAPEWTLSALQHTFCTFCLRLYLYLSGFSANNDHFTLYETLVLFLMGISFYTLPQLLVALCGGLLAHRFAKGAGWRP